MTEFNINEPNQNKYPNPVKMTLQMNNVKNSRNSMNRLAKAYMKGTVENSVFRNMTYFFSQYINILRLESDLQIEKRLKDLEEKINATIK